MIKIIKFLINDIKQDLIIIKNALTGKYQAQHSFQEVINNIFTINFLERNWLYFLTLITAVLAGMFLGSQYYQNQCNELIITNLLG